MTASESVLCALCYCAGELFLEVKFLVNEDT